MAEAPHGRFRYARGLPLQAGLLVVLTLAALASRTIMPIDETRYLGVAWEMWQRGDFLVPYRNGEAYSHKPPLLFWTIHAGWAAFGVNEIWPRLVPPLIALATLAVTRRIATVLWPDAPWRAERASWILLGCLLFALFAEMLMFDMLLALWVAIGVLGLVEAPRAPLRGFALLAAAIGGGVLAKGPVVLLHLLPASVLAPWWLRDRSVSWRGWYAGVILAVLGGAAVALAWAIPAGLRGGEDYRNAIFWGQTANRMVDSFAHQRPIWWYLPLVPILVAPWFLWRPFWHGVARAGILADRGGRLGLALAIVTLAAFSLISGKQVHYLVPQLPAFALVATLAIDGQQRAARPWIAAAGVAAAGVAVLVLPHVRLPQNLAALQSISPAWTLPFFALAAWLVWQPRTPDRLVPAMASSSVLMLAAMHLAFVRPLSPAYDVGPIARKLGELQAAGRPVAHDGVYHGQYQFVGRLEKPIEELSNHGEAERWISAHPDGVLVLYFRPPADPAPYSPLLSQPYRGRVAALFEAQAASAPLAAASAEDEADEPPTPPRRRPVVPR